jgi:hypothetical protein
VSTRRSTRCRPTQGHSAPLVQGLRRARWEPRASHLPFEDVGHLADVGRSPCDANDRPHPRRSTVGGPIGECMKDYNSVTTRMQWHEMTSQI